MAATKFISLTALTEFLSKIKTWASEQFATKAQVNAKLSGSYGSDQTKFLRNDGSWAVPTASVTVDSTLSDTSVNPVQNKVIKGVLDNKANVSDIPAAVTESTVSGWGFTKNTGTYSKPSGGIPKTDLASAVQTSLGKADTALQSHQDISGKVDKIDITAQGTQAVYPIKINAQGQIISYGSAVTVPAAVRVKGNSESSYRTGDVNLTAANIGAATASHTHGNIQNGGTLQTNDVAIASGDKLVITDSSDSNKIARSSLSFDGSTTTQFLSKAGTFVTPTVSVTIDENTTFNISGTTFKIALVS